MSPPKDVELVCVNAVQVEPLFVDMFNTMLHPLTPVLFRTLPENTYVPAVGRIIVVPVVGPGPLTEILVALMIDQDKVVGVPDAIPAVVAKFNLANPKQEFKL